MKNKVLILSFIWCSVNAISQNLVPNGGFEDYTSCPWNTAQLDYTGTWMCVGASTDYYNSCEPTNFVSVPYNLYGYQHAFEGNGYIGMNVMGLHEDTMAQYMREPAGTFLTDTLEIGAKYYVSFKVVLTLNNFESCCASNKIGALFSTNSFTDCNGGNPAPINNFAHVYTNDIITDSLNWTRIYGSFIADSAYKFVSIGTFFDSTQISVIDYFNNYPATCASYYYVDDIRVSMDSSFVLNDNIIVTELNELNVFPNPSNGYLYIENNLNICDITVFDISGRVLYNDPKFNSRFMDLRFLGEGEYFLILKSESALFQSRFIITK